MNFQTQPALLPPLAPELLARFIAIVGPKYAVTDPQIQEPYLVEMRDLFHGVTPVVLRPGSVAEVAAILKLANETKTAIVPQGGNTVLVGGQIPHRGEIILSLTRLDKIRGRSRFQHHDSRSRRHLEARARSRRRRRPALSAIATVGRHLYDRRQSVDQCRRHR